MGEHVGYTADEVAEEGSDDRLRYYDLVIAGPAFEMEELDAYRLCSEYLLKLVCGDSVPADKSFKDVETFGGEDIDAAVLEEM